MARAYLETAELVANERKQGFSNVTAGLAVLAGIAASDAICCVRLGRYHRGDDHRRATELLETATPDGRDLAVRLERLLGLKDTAHYGAALVADQRQPRHSLGTTARQSSTGGGRTIGAATVSASALRDRLTGISRFSARRPEQKNVILGWFSGCAFWTAPFFKRHLRFAPEPSFGRDSPGMHSVSRPEHNGFLWVPAPPAHSSPPTAAPSSASFT